MTNEDIVDRLDTVIAVFKLAHRDQIDDARAVIRADKVKAAILDHAADDWVPAGELNAAVVKETKQSGSTVKRRVAELLSDGVLKKSGSGPTIAYKATGLI